MIPFLIIIIGIIVNLLAFKILVAGKKDFSWRHGLFGVVGYLIPMAALAFSPELFNVTVKVKYLTGHLLIMVVIMAGINCWLETK